MCICMYRMRDNSSVKTQRVLYVCLIRVIREGRGNADSGRKKIIIIKEDEKKN